LANHRDTEHTELNASHAAYGGSAARDAGRRATRGCRYVRSRPA